jgi:hypothetical protein
MLSLSVDLTSEELDELIKELELDEDIDKIEIRTTQSAGFIIGVTLAANLLTLLLGGMFKIGKTKFKKVVKKVLEKANKKSKQEAKLNLNYEDLHLVFNSSEDKAIYEKINELADYMEIDYD